MAERARRLLLRGLEQPGQNLLANRTVRGSTRGATRSCAIGVTGGWIALACSRSITLPSTRHTKLDSAAWSRERLEQNGPQEGRGCETGNRCRINEPLQTGEWSAAADLETQVCLLLVPAAGRGTFAGAVEPAAALGALNLGA